LSEYPKTEKFYVHCAGGYRSMIASSILKSRGFHNLVDIKGGYKAIEKTSVSRSEYICPSLI
jgi:hydroxyacylglutathione hydrolase